MKHFWQDRIQKIYASLEELEAYDAMYSISSRLGFQDAADLWEKNPLIQGSVNSADLKVA